MKGKSKGFGRLHIEIDFNIAGARQRRFINLNERIHESLLSKGKLKSHLQTNLVSKVEKELFDTNEFLRDIEKVYSSVTPEQYDIEISKKNGQLQKNNATILSAIEEFISEKKNYLDNPGCDSLSSGIDHRNQHSVFADFSRSL